MKSRIALLISFILLFLSLTGCSFNSFVNKQDSAVTVKLMIGRDKQWIFDEVQNILIQNNIKVNGKTVKIITDQAGSGEAMTKILEPDSDYVGWMPASSTYIQWANKRWYEYGNLKPRVNEEATTVFLTPTVIAMQESLSKSMGYPQNKIGWEDIFNLAASKDGWGLYGNASINPVKFAHTHPAKSNSGINSLIAEEYAFSKKTKGLTVDDIRTNSDKLKTVEQTIVHYGDSTSLLQKKIVEKGPKFIQFAVLYEYMVADMNSKSNGTEKTIAIYPKEGTIWGDVSFTDVYSKKFDEEQKLALKEIKKILLSDKIQIKGMNEYFFRPANTNIPLSGAISEKLGVNPEEPVTTLELPKTEVIDAILEDWENTMKKRANVTFAIDTSESMSGAALDSLKPAMTDILGTSEQKSEFTGLNSEDDISLIAFNNEINEVFTVKGNENGIMKSGIGSLKTYGGTKLYDAIIKAIEKNREIASANKGKTKKINMVVVLTDGRDTNSQIKYEQLISYIDAHQGDLPVIFTVGYGNVDEAALTAISEKTGGKYYKGNPQTIKQLFEEIRTYF